MANKWASEGINRESRVGGSVRKKEAVSSFDFIQMISAIGYLTTGRLDDNPCSTGHTTKSDL